MLLYNRSMPTLPDATLQALAQAPIFQGLPPAGLQEVLRHAQSCQARKDEFFFMQGDDAKHLYILTEGRVKLSQVTLEGQQVILRVLGAWQMFGGIALLGNDVFPVSAEAVEDSQALRWTAEALQMLVQRYPALALNAMRWMADHAREMQDLFRQLATERVEKRLARALLRLARQLGRKTAEGVLIDFPLSRQDLAEMSGTTLYTVSRVLSQWEKDGLVRSGRERVVVLHPHRLVAIAEDL